MRTDKVIVLPFDFDAIMVDTPAQTAENDESCHHTPLTEGQYQEWDQDNSSIEMEQVVSPPINIESLPLEYPSAQAALPNLSESDSDDLENLVQFGMNIWPEKKLDQFRPGQPVTAGILNELLCKVLPAPYAIGIPPRRIHKLKETCAGCVIPYHVNEVDQLTRVESEKNHFVVAIVDMENKKFTSWGMTEEMHRSSRVEYEKALGISLAEDRCKVSKLAYSGDLIKQVANYNSLGIMPVTPVLFAASRLCDAILKKTSL